MTRRKITAMSFLSSLVLLSILSVVGAQGTIHVTLETVDPEGNPLNGRVSVKGSFGRIDADSPLVYEQADGGGVGIAGGWRGLSMSHIGVTVSSGTTYTIDPLTKTVTSTPTQGVTRINIVFEPIDVRMATVDTHGNPLNGQVFAQNTNGICSIPRTGGTSPDSYQQANGGGATFIGGWRGLSVSLVPVAISRNTTYTINALTRVVTSEPTENVTAVNIMFDPIEVTVAMVDWNGDPLYGWLAVQNTSGFCSIPRITESHSVTYVQANGGGVNCYAQWSGLDSGWFGVGITKDTTYWINALTKQATSEWTPDTNKVNLFFAISATVDIDPDVLNLKSTGKWITCYIELPEGYDVDQINIDRIFLEGLLAVQHSDIQDRILMVKFDRQDVIAYIESVLETVPPDDVILTVTGELEDGISFEGSDTIRIIDSGSKKE